MIHWFYKAPVVKINFTIFKVKKQFSLSAAPHRRRRRWRHIRLLQSERRSPWQLTQEFQAARKGHKTAPPAANPPRTEPEQELGASLRPGDQEVPGRKPARGPSPWQRESTRESPQQLLVRTPPPLKRKVKLSKLFCLFVHLIWWLLTIVTINFYLWFFYQLTK